MRQYSGMFDFDRTFDFDQQFDLDRTFDFALVPTVCSVWRQLKPLCGNTLPCHQITLSCGAVTLLMSTSHFVAGASHIYFMPT